MPMVQGQSELLLTGAAAIVAEMLRDPAINRIR